MPAPGVGFLQFHDEDRKQKISWHCPFKGDALPEELGLTNPRPADIFFCIISVQQILSSLFQRLAVDLQYID